MRPTPADTLGADLHTLAHWVACRLDAGDRAAAFAATLLLEQAAGIRWDETLPAAPVIGRRFARAHGLLAKADEPRPRELARAVRAASTGRGSARPVLEHA